MQNSYTVINASAGSGKTYALVQRLLMICLRYPGQQNNIRNILALTFTNKAANEMKERILTWLGDFASENYEKNEDLKNIQKEYEKEGLKLNLKELHDRSKKLLDYVLHNYSTLNIGTIDKFNAKLVRSFSYELGLAKNFNLEVNAEPFLIEAVDQMLDKIGSNNEASKAFIDYVNYSLDNEKRINLNKTLYDSAKVFVNDVHYEKLKSNAEFGNENYEAATEKLRTEIKNLQIESEVLAKNSLKIINDKGLENSDFAGGGNKTIFYFFDNFLQKKAPKLYETISEEDHKIEYYKKGASKVGKAKEHLIFEILDSLLINRVNIIKNYITIQKKEKILTALLPLKVNKEIQNELAKIEDENDLVLLSKFNILINENLRNEPSEFIYEKVGTQFQHYFFDEFQDTSVLQWQNFVPLRDHSVSTNGTSFTLVGDPKQSIYRFRGGESQLMLNIINKKEISPKEAKVENLEFNRRSAENIVKFNNELYKHHSEGIKNLEYYSDDHVELFGELAQQIPLRKEKIQGRVKINLIENLTKDDFYNDTSEKMLMDIQNCINHGFKFSDITILCRGNNDIFNYSQKLGALKVNYNGSETSIKTISESGLTLELSDTLNAVIYFLNWEINSKNLQYLTMMIYHLHKLGKVEITDFTTEMLDILNFLERDEMVAHLKEKYNLNLYKENFQKLNLYNFVEYYVHEFSVHGKETDFLLNFLEVLYGFTQNTGATTKDFIKFWNEEAHKMTIQASENLDAIQIMTIHKAKGLEFPVVLLPMENKNKDGEFNDWFEMDEDFGLHSVNMDQFSKNLEVYDSEIQNFNQENGYRNFIDRLCIQYVATTRAVEQLYLYLQKPTFDKKNEKENDSKIEIYDFVQKKNPKNLDEFDYFEELNAKDLQKKTKDKIKKHHTKNIETLVASSEENSKIKIATPSKNYQNRNKKVRAGIFVHEILSKINSEKDVEKVLGSYFLEGTISAEEKVEIHKNIQKIIEQYPHYFKENLEIINEKEIMISEDGNTKIYRPDRIIKKETGYIIIDFKTGEEHEKYKKQILNYQKILENLGKKVLQTEIVYL